MYRYLFTSLLSVILGIYSEMELGWYLLASCGSSMLIFCGTAVLFSTTAAPFTLPQQCTKGSFQFFQILSTLVIFWVFVCLLIIAIIVVARCFDLHFPNDYWVRLSIFSCTYWPTVFGEMSVQCLFAHFELGCIFCWSSLCILVINLLLDMLYANIFSHPVDYCFTPW